MGNLDKKYLLTSIFPFIIISLNFLSAIIYFIVGDYRKATYWFAATVLNCSILSF